jgi:D-cysteine desulfhydrase family pyridoxal phosphate-dependent enzyme
MTLSIAEALKVYTRETLTRRPTPLDHLPQLSEKLGVEFYIKRDDLTDLALGGDKPRKLEYEIAKARADGADMIVTCGSSQSNHARLTTAAAKKLGLDCSLVLSRDQHKAFQGNLLSVVLMGPDIRFVETADHWDLESQALELCEDLRSQGRRPYYIPVSGTTPLSCLGYVEAGLELSQQIEGEKLEFDAIYTPFGTGGIFSALLLTLRAEGITSALQGISVNRETATCLENLEEWWAAISNSLNREEDGQRGEYAIHDEFIGQEYGHATDEGLDAILLMAQREGIFLDPVYSGKVFAGALAHIEEGRWIKGDRILMVHSGGVPALFAYQDEIWDHLKKRGQIPSEW